jgi:hypothetical protein
VTKLREMYDQSINVSKGKITEDFMSSFEYLAGRMRDIEIKLRIIIDGLQFR